MGTKMAPTYATLVMGYLETKLYNKFEEKYGITAKNQFIARWWRCLDDCFLIWDHNLDNSESILALLQSLHKKIQLTMEESKQNINFQDVKIIVENSQLITDLYQKSTDTQQYVHFQSRHPPHQKECSIQPCTALLHHHRERNFKRTTPT